MLPMTDEKRQEILAQNKAMADQGSACAGGGLRRVGGRPAARIDSPEYLEQDLCFVGLAGMIDPVRPEVKAAIAAVPHGRHPAGHDHRRPQGYRRGHRQGAGRSSRRSLGQAITGSSSGRASATRS